MKRVLAVFLLVAATPGSLRSSSTGGSATSVMACAGFAPAPCARQDAGITLGTNGFPSNGPSFFTTGAVNQVNIDPYFGERVIRVTNRSTAANASGDSWETPNAGWVRAFNCSGNFTTAACQSGTAMFYAFDATAGGGVVVFTVNRSTLNLTRVDNASFTGNKVIGTSFVDWSGINPNLLYASTQSNETSSAAMNYKSYLFNPSSPGTPSPTLLLNLNTGPHSKSFDQQTGSGGLISALDGLLSVKGWPAAIAPIVCDGASCIEQNATPSGSTCGTVTGGLSGAACITVSTTGGSLSGKFSFAVDEDDGGTPPTEQNISGWSDNSPSQIPLTTYNFSGGSGKVTAVTAPSQITSPVTAANWDFYVAGPGLQWESSATSLAVRQFQIAYSSATSCPGTGCPTFPFTGISSSGGSQTFTTTVSANHPVNYSCEQGHAAGNCSLQQAQVSNDDTRFGFDTGGIGQGVCQIVLVWDTTKGARWIDLSKGTVSNGTTDAAGNSCGSAQDCWGSTGSGAIAFHPDPNASGLNTVWQGLLMHEMMMSLDGNWVYLGNQIPPANGDGPFWWNVNTGDVYQCGSTATNCDFGGHPGIGYEHWYQTGNGNPPIDGNLDNRGKTLSGSICTGSGCSLSSTPYIQQIYSFSNTGPCSFGGACTIPPPNYSTTGWNFIGSGRADSHMSMIDENPTDTMPYDLFPYNVTITESISTTSGSVTRTGCPSACLDTFKVSAGAATFLPGDLVTITGLADNSFNISCYVSAIPTWNGTTFQCPDPGKSNAATQAISSSIGRAYKADTTPGRAWENEVILISPAYSPGQSATVYRITHSHYDLVAGGTNTGPNGSISPDGHFALWTTTDGSGGAISTATLGSVSGSGGSGYAVGDTGTISNPANGATLATYKVTAVGSGGAVTGFTITSAGTLYIAMNNVQTTTGGSHPGSGSSFLVNITAVTAGRTDVALAEIR